MPRNERLSAMDNAEIIEETEISAFEPKIIHLVIHLVDEPVQRPLRLLVPGLNADEIRIGSNVWMARIAEKDRYRGRLVSHLLDARE